MRIQDAGSSNISIRAFGAPGTSPSLSRATTGIQLPDHFLPVRFIALLNVSPPSGKVRVDFARLRAQQQKIISGSESTMLQQFFNHSRAPGFKPALHIPDFNDNRTHPSWNHDPLSLSTQHIKGRPLQNLRVVLSLALVAITLESHCSPEEAREKECRDHGFFLGDSPIGILKPF